MKSSEIWLVGSGIIIVTIPPLPMLSSKLIISMKSEIELTVAGETLKIDSNPKHDYKNK
jgi:hypothetical protein